MKKLSIITTAAILAVSPVFASTVNILWYTGGAKVTSTAGSYETVINALAVQEANPIFNISGSINTWNITYWTGGAKPVGTFNVLVAAAAAGPWNTNPNYLALTTGVNAASFGDRVMLTGQDADWHLAYTPGPGLFNNPAGFLIDAVNWAGSGTGMGGVFLNTGVEGSIFSGFGTSQIANNIITIPPAYAAFPINAGLTSAGLSGWNDSAHDTFNITDSSKWTAINTTAAGPAITIVSAATAGGGTSSVPDTGSTLAMLLLSVVSFGVIRHFVRGEGAALS